MIGLVLMAVTYTLYLGGVPRLDLKGVHNLPTRYTGIECTNFQRNYDDPARVSFSLIGEWAPYPFGADVQVELYHGDVRVFEGLTDLPSVIFTADNQKAVQYTAEDRRATMDRVIAKTSPEQLPDFPPPERQPQIDLPAGPLSEAVDALLAHVGEDMLSKGVNNLVDFAGDGADQLQSRGVSLSDTTIDRAFVELAASVPGCRVFMNPSAVGLPRYTFVNLFGTATRDIYIDETRISELPIQASTKGCAGAVKIYGGLTHGNTSARFNVAHRVFRAWNPDYEKEWSKERAGGLMQLLPGAPDEHKELFKVFRVWSFEGIDVPRKKIIGCVRRKPPGDFDDVGGGPDYFETLRIDSINFEDQTITLMEPAVNLNASPARLHCPGNVSAASSSLGGDHVFICWSDEDSASVDITIQPIRYPETGFAGRAAALAPIKCTVEKDITVPPGVDRTVYAVQAWMAYSEPVFSGSLPINDDLPADLMFLARRINLKTRNHGGTGFEVMAAPIMGVNVSFLPQIQSELEFSKDFSAMVSGGQA
jgi:hypothetical protein